MLKFTNRTNLAAVDKALANFPTVAMREMKEAESDVAELMATAASDYPPERPNQIYKRTYDLKAGWLNARPEWNITSKSVTATLTNPVAYAGSVQGDPQNDWVQGAYFKDRWASIPELREKNRAAIRMIYLDFLKRVAGQLRW